MSHEQSLSHLPYLHSVSCQVFKKNYYIISIIPEKLLIFTINTGKILAMFFVCILPFALLLIIVCIGGKLTPKILIALSAAVVFVTIFIGSLLIYIKRITPILAVQLSSDRLSVIILGKSVHIYANSDIKFITQVSMCGYDINRIRTTPISRLSLLINDGQIDLWDFDGIHDAQLLSQAGNDLLFAWQVARPDKSSAVAPTRAINLKEIDENSNT